MRGSVSGRVLRASALLSSLILAACADQSALTAPNAPLTPSPRAEATPTATGLPLVITEVMPDPSRVADDVGEWIEIFNPNENAVDLNGYRLASGPAFPATENHTVNTSVLVPPCGVVVLGRNASTTTNGGAPVAYSYGTSITLNNSNTDWLTLKDANGALVDSVSYSTRSGGAIVPPSVSPSSGISFVVGDPALDNTIIAGNSNWSLTPTTITYGLGDRGSPGTSTYTCGGPGPGPITSVTVTPSNGNVQVGQTTGFTATARDANNVVVTTTFTWMSSNTAVATVNASGVVTGVSQGTVTITATAPNGVSGTATATVVPAGQPASITVSVNTPARWPVGFTKPAFATVRDAGGNIISPPPPLTWSSNNNAVATVDGLGYITGVSPGTAQIRVETTGGIFATVTVTIIPADAITTAVYRNHIEFGRPIAVGSINDLDYVTVNRRQYRAAWSSRRGGPTWVSWNLNATQFGDAPRCDCFSTDLGLPSWVPRIVDFDYRNGGYDRGHMVQSESRTTTDQENAASFLLTNILPQAGENNQGPWLRFENYLNDQARLQNREVYVIAGPEYGAVPPTLKNEGKVFVPNWTWKVAVIVPAGQGLPFVTSPDVVQVIAIRMPNRVESGVEGSAVGIRNLPWENFATSVDDIEARTGLDLLSRLPDPIEAIVEARIFGAPALMAASAGSLLDLRSPGWH
jgi:DNA/RNA endonuclease G (NUC1)